MEELLEFKIVPHGSSDYKKIVRLREELLRKPLGLSFSPEELARENNFIHVGAFIGDELCASAMLVPHGVLIKMQRVVVAQHFQGKGIGSKLTKFCEKYVHGLGYREMFVHARETAMKFYLQNKYLPEGKMFIEQTIPHQKMRKKLGN